MTSAITKGERTARRRVDKFAERQAELAEAALQTLSELGYARTSLREIAQHSDFSHGVLHYYFHDKVDLILCGVRQYKARCVTRYDQVTAEAGTYEQLMDGFLVRMAATLCEEARLHRLWYDLRAQAMFEAAFRPEVAAIDASLQNMIWRVIERFAQLNGRPQTLLPATCYALLDGLFQQHLLRHLAGDQDAADDLQASLREVLLRITGGPA